MSVIVDEDEDNELSLRSERVEGDHVAVAEAGAGEVVAVGLASV